LAPLNINEDLELIFPDETNLQDETQWVAAEVAAAGFS
jgi:hypothetical protein